MKKTREPYRTNCAGELAEIDEKRKRLGVSIGDMCAASGVPIATFRRMRRSGLAFRRSLKALAFALRTIERQQKNAEDYFPAGASGGGS